MVGTLMTRTPNPFLAFRSFSIFTTAVIHTSCKRKHLWKRTLEIFFPKLKLPLIPFRARNWLHALLQWSMPNQTPVPLTVYRWVAFEDTGRTVFLTNFVITMAQRAATVPMIIDCAFGIGLSGHTANTHCLHWLNLTFQARTS